MAGIEQKGRAKGIPGIAKHLLPGAVVRELRQFRSYAPNERPLYLKLRISSALGWKNLKNSHAPKTARRLLFVCFGNIMRSPMCEVLTKRELLRSHDTQFAAASAGLNATEGRSAHDWAIVAAQKFDVSLGSHKARLLTGVQVEQADAIFVMDYRNLVQLLARWPAARKKVFMMAAYASPDYRPVEIPDPYYLGERETYICFNVLNTCVRNLVLSLTGREFR